MDITSINWGEILNHLELLLRLVVAAAGIWMTAAIGVTVAVGWYGTAVFSTVLVLAVLYFTRLPRGNEEEGEH